MKPLLGNSTMFVLSLTSSMSSGVCRGAFSFMSAALCIMTVAVGVEVAVCRDASRCSVLATSYFKFT